MKASDFQDKSNKTRVDYANLQDREYIRLDDIFKTEANSTNSKDSKKENKEKAEEFMKKAKTEKVDYISGHSMEFNITEESNQNESDSIRTDEIKPIREKRLAEHFGAKFSNISKQEGCKIKTDSSGRKLDNETVCPKTEVYVVTYKGAQYTKVEVNDHKIKPSDNSQIVVGTYYTGIDDTVNKNFKTCFIAKLDHLGNHMTSMYFEYLTNPSLYDSECYSVVITQNREIVVAGTLRRRGTTQTQALIIKSEPENLGTISTELHPNYLVSLWSPLISRQEGHGVDATWDGGIYVVGHQSQWTRGGTDCYIMRLNHTLERVYVRSFGTRDNDYCNSVQVTRNNDYAYVGGYKYNTEESKWEIFVVKLNNAYGTYSSTNGPPVQRNVMYVQAANNGIHLKLRRIIMTQKVNFNNNDDQNEIYFCGQLSTDSVSVVNGNLVFGKLNSGQYLTSFENVYSYGSPSNEYVGDCALSSDNQYFVAVFSTDQVVLRTASDLRWNFTGSAAFDAVGDPFQCNWGNPAGSDIVVVYDEADCRLQSNWPDLSQFQKFALSCIDQFLGDYRAYIAEYQDRVYSWTSCDDYYYYNTRKMNCSVDLSNMLALIGCTATYNGQTGYFQVGNGAPGSGNYDLIDCRATLANLNIVIDMDDVWPSGRGNAEFLYRVYQRLNMQDGDSQWKPYWYCNPNGVVDPLDWDDTFYFVFEQDCKYDLQKNGGRLSYDWFMIRVDIDDIDNNRMGSIPEEAAFWGDRWGDDWARSVQVDDMGYVTIHGLTEATRFHSDNSGVVKSPAWMHAKTHWSFRYEVDYNGVNNPVYPVPDDLTIYNDIRQTFIKKKFMRPKRFQNGGNHVFLRDMNTNNYFTETSYFGEIWPDVEAFGGLELVNEDIYKNAHSVDAFKFQTTFYTTKAALTKNTIAQSFYSMNNQFEFTLIKGQEFQKSLAHFCTISRNYSQKRYQVTVPTNAAGLTGVNYQIPNSQEFTAQPILTGTPTATEEIYYVNYLAYTQQTIPFPPNNWNNGNGGCGNNGNGNNNGNGQGGMGGNWCGWSDTYPMYCPWNDYWSEQNNIAYYTQGNFLLEQRMKIIVDDIYTLPPTPKQNILDLNITVGHRFASTDYRNQFQGTCQYSYARQSKSQSYPRSTMMPYWMQYFERNGTFIMYPPEPDFARGDSQRNFNIEVFCCNNIDQCSSITIGIYLKNADPNWNTTFTDPTFVVHYDKSDQVGQAWSFSQNTSIFWDTDTITDNPYNRQSHTIWHSWDYSQAKPTGFKGINWIGMFFGQAITANTYQVIGGVNNLYTQMQDRHSRTIDFYGKFKVTLKVLANTIPQVTTSGKSATLGQISPSYADAISDYFDEFFPFLKEETIQGSAVKLNQDVSGWFKEWDSGDSYSLTISMSDDTIPPLWIAVSNTNLVAFPGREAGSQLLNLKVKATDQFGGTNYVIKTLMVNSSPAPMAFYKSIRITAGRRFGLNISSFFTDADGDNFTISFPNSADVRKMTRVGLKYYEGTKFLGGTPEFSMTLRYMKVRATDIHGSTGTMFLTLDIGDGKPDIRQKALPMQDVTVQGGAPFVFVYKDDQFFDADGEPLILYATSEYDDPLPEWMRFTPHSRTFYGYAPDKAYSFKIQMRAMNPVSQDSVSREFMFYVLPNSHPISNVVSWPADLVLTVNDTFTVPIPQSAIYDPEVNVHPKMTMSGGMGKDIPEWIKFNSASRVVSGKAEQPGTYILDFRFEDDLGKYAYANIKITVKPKPVYTGYRMDAKSYVVSFFFLIGMMVYLAFVVHAVFLMPLQDTAMLKILQQVQKRFGNYREINIEVYDENDPTMKAQKPVQDPVKTINRPIFNKPVKFKVDKNAPKVPPEFLS